MVGDYFDWYADDAGARCAIAACVARGHPSYQEDRIAVARTPEWLLAAVIDGHGGCGAADFVQEHICGVMADALSADCDTAASVARAFERLDERARTHILDDSGACVIVAAISLSKVVLAGLGDCRALSALCGGSALLPTHSVDREMGRLHACGADIRLYRGRARVVLKRTNKSLNVARSIGDFAGKPSVISSIPDVVVLSREKIGCWLALSSDGIADAVGDSGVFDHVCRLRRALSGPSSASIPFAMCHAASICSSRDNMSFLFIKLSNDDTNDDTNDDETNDDKRTLLSEVCSARMHEGNKLSEALEKDAFGRETE